jgi:hypothetical protein
MTFQRCWRRSKHGSQRPWYMTGVTFLSDCRSAPDSNRIVGGCQSTSCLGSANSMLCTGRSDRYALERDKNNSATWPSGQWVGDVRGAAKETQLDAAVSRWTGGFPKTQAGTGPLSLCRLGGPRMRRGAEAPVALHKANATACSG